MIDLHTHSTASDGTLTPAELVRLAKKSKLDALALTDHDTLSGLDQALHEGAACGLEVIPGCELSVGAGKQSMHLLGLWTAPDSPALTKALEFVHEGRNQRNLEMIERLNALGVNIAMEEVAALAAGTVGRPHMAKVLLDKGYATSFDHAFYEFVGNAGKAYVPRARLTEEQAITALKQDGALAVLAHPALLGQSYAELNRTLGRLRELGLDGMEVYYTEHDARTMDLYFRLADAHGLAVSGGSDFHGAVKPKIFLGRGKGSLYIPLRVLEDLKAYRRERGLWV